MKKSIKIPFKDKTIFYQYYHLFYNQLNSLVFRKLVKYV